MKIKKLILLAMCVIAMVFSLASCDDGEIGSYLPNYDWKPEVIEDVKLDLYIVVGEGTTENAMTTVRDKINQHLDDKYHTTLAINYIKESEYAAKIAEITAAGSTKNTGIVLINSKTMMDSLLASNSLVDIASYLDTKNFGKLNTQITPALLGAAYENESKVVDGKDVTVEHLYCIPNDHVVDEYEYIVIDKRVAKDMLNFTLTELSSMTTWEATEALRNAVEAHSSTLGVTVDQVVSVKTGSYELRNSYKSDDGYICNVSKVPTVTKEEVYSSAFGILAGTENKDRAMEIIYAINTDVELRNYLQYGVEYTNYTVVDDLVVPTTDPDSLYVMNLLYTGDVFNALYCEAEGFVKWNEDAKKFGELQNADSVIYSEDTPADDGSSDSDNDSNN